MTLALTRAQFYALIVLVFLTVVALTLVTLYTVAHIDVWHILSNMVVPQGGTFPYH